MTKFEWTDVQKKFVQDNWLILTAQQIATSISKFSPMICSRKMVERLGKKMGLDSKKKDNNFQKF